MEHLPKKIHQNGISYTLVGDYYIPDLELPEESRPIGRWGRMHKAFLQEHRPGQYNALLLSGKLWTYLADLNEQAADRLACIVSQMQEAEGVTEELKARDQLAWVGGMNSIRSRAEEIILSEMILSEGGGRMILEEMYNGRFYPCETVVADSSRFKQAVKASAALMDTLSERLSKEDYALVEELREQVAIAQCEENESHFKYGFSAGLLVQQEAHTQVSQKDKE